MKLACVCMACSALKDPSKHLLTVLQVPEVFCGVDGGFNAVGYGESAKFGGVLLFLLPYFSYQALGSTFGVCSGGAEGYFTSVGGDFFC